MDWTSIVTSCLTLAGVVITVLVGNNSRDVKTDSKIDMVNTTLSNQLTLVNQTVESKINTVNDSVTRLEKKQEKYNNLQERTFSLEKDMAFLSQQIKSMDTNANNWKMFLDLYSQNHKDTPTQ